jgi:uncharacterized membrane protein
MMRGADLRWAYEQGSSTIDALLDAVPGALLATLVPRRVGERGVHGDIREPQT